jgi:signal transduction histidine kinase
VEGRAVNSTVEMITGNTGDGIPEDRTGQLFERFYRVRGDERVPGHGLGLSIARELARAHGAMLSWCVPMMVGQRCAFACREAPNESKRPRGHRQAQLLSRPNL